MDKSLDLYKIFYSVCTSGSISDAARELFITQPAVSQSVRRLEDELGVRLFVRRSKGVVLTREGEILRNYVSAAMGMLETGESRMRMLAMLEEGELRIGASDTVSKWFLLPVIQNFHETYPNITLSMTNRTTADTVSLLRSGRIDIGFVNLPVGEPDVQCERCMPVHDVFVAGERFAGLKGRPVSPEELAGYPLVMLESKSNSRRWVNKYFSERNVTLHPEFELSTHDLLVEFARVNLGIACVVREFARDSIAGGSLFEIQLEPAVPQRSIGVCYSSGIEPSPAAQRLIELAKLHGSEFVGTI